MTNEQFEKTFKENFNLLCNTAYNIVHEYDVARDIVQHVMLNFWEKKNKITIQTSLLSYMNRAIINTSLNYIEKNKKVLFVESHEEYIKSSDYNLSDNKIDSKELQKLVRCEIDKLPSRCKVVFSLSRFEEMSNKEIAGHLGISVKAVEKHITKALKILRTSLKPLWEMNLLMILSFLFTCIINI